MNFYLQNSQGTIYTLEKSFNVTGTSGRPIIADFRPMFPDWSPRLDYLDRIGQDGSVVTSDRRTGYRNLTFKFDLAADTDADARDSLNFIIGFFRPNNAPFYLYDTDNLIRTQVEFGGLILDKTDVLQYRTMKDNELRLIMSNAYWEDSTESSAISPTSGTASGDTIIVSNTGDVDLYPIFDIEALVDISSFRIENTTLQGGFEIEDLDFSAGSVFNVNCRTGEITLNDVEKSSSLTAGGFIFMQPGANTITYTSSDGPVDITITYRRRYAY